MYVSTCLFFLTSTKLVLRVQQIASIVVREALQNFSYDGKIVHNFVPIMYMLMYFYNIDNMLFSFPVCAQWASIQIKPCYE